MREALTYCAIFTAAGLGLLFIFGDHDAHSSVRPAVTPERKAEAEPYPWPSLEETLDEGGRVYQAAVEPDEEEAFDDRRTLWTLAPDNWGTIMEQTGTSDTAEEWAIFAESWDEGREPEAFAEVTADLFEQAVTRHLWTQSQRSVALFRSVIGNNEDHPTAHRIDFWQGSPCLCESHGGVPLWDHPKLGPIARAWWDTDTRLSAIVTEALSWRLPLQETE